MFERILIPLDGSSRAEAILEHVARIVRREDSEILLVRIIQAPLSYDTEDLNQSLARQREEAQTYLHDVSRRFAGRGAKIHARIEEGQSAEAILEIADREGATMLAMSTHGRTGLSRWMMGSVAEKVARSSRLPMLIVRSFQCGIQGDLESIPPVELPFRRILVPVDGSPASLSIIGSVEKMAQLYGSEVLVIHVRPIVLPPGAILPGMEAGLLIPPPSRLPQKDEATREAAERFEQAGLKVTRVSALGDAASEILDQGAERKVDLIAMATHGRTGIGRWILGSVAERVLRSATVPLLLVRPGA